MADAIAIAMPIPTTRPAINPWIVAMTVTLAAFMEVLDSSIANVALPHMAGSLGARAPGWLPATWSPLRLCCR